MIVLDTSVLLALLNQRDADHREVAAWYRDLDEDLTTTPLVLAEVDYLARRVGWSAVRAFREDLRRGAYEVEWWPGAESAAAAIADRYDDLRLDLADASLVVLAELRGTTRIATLDERDFRVVRPLTGEAAFTLLPHDAVPA